MPGEGFYTVKQELNFHSAAVRVRRGGSDAAVCGAKTRTGGACQALPIKTSVRCIRHCGPKAARAHRHSQWQALVSGKLPHKEWALAEAKRAANRLREGWKKNPWLPGSTIDLGVYEDAFCEAVQHFRATLPELPSATMDWLRWRYRRLQIDRMRDREWLQVLREELPKRLAHIRPPPLSALNQHSKYGASVEMQVKVSANGAFSKRFQLEQPKAPKGAKYRSLRRVGRPKSRSTAENEQNFDLFIFEHRKLLGDCFSRCSTDEQSVVVEALRSFLSNPNDSGSLDRWMHIIQTLWHR